LRMSTSHSSDDLNGSDTRSFCTYRHLSGVRFLVQ
jgi:hypothetical protein